MKQPIRTRLNTLIEALKLSEIKFATEIGTSSAMISKIINKDVNFGVDIIHKISHRYPEVNINWLLLGVGEMYNQSVTVETAGKTKDLTSIEKPLNSLLKDYQLMLIENPQYIKASTPDQIKALTKILNS
ncbi:helix-turn-helix transcriptional regulator [Pedobacter antarcticus]|uniref:helix-turn-helix domain-containing protein n=1 Tax=Pedobacter antarcticus TaxID=34086 RepID=UPI002930A33D|nr:helix-turn-helix transcriptional regulator [Pedobacter antarcticus]